MSKRLSFKLFIILGIVILLLALALLTIRYYYMSLPITKLYSPLVKVTINNTADKVINLKAPASYIVGWKINKEMTSANCLLYGPDEEDNLSRMVSGLGQFEVAGSGPGSYFYTIDCKKDSRSYLDMVEVSIN